MILHPIRPPSMNFCRTAGPRRTQNTFSPRGSKNPAKPKLAAESPHGPQARCEVTVDLLTVTATIPL